MIHTPCRIAIKTRDAKKGGTVMKKQILEQKLISLGVPSHMYSLHDGLPNEAYCLNKNNRFWEVYYSERGIKSGVKQFDSEEEACEYFYRLIVESL